MPKTRRARKGRGLREEDPASAVRALRSALPSHEPEGAPRVRPDVHTRPALKPGKPVPVDAEGEACYFEAAQIYDQLLADFTAAHQASWSSRAGRRPQDLWSGKASGRPT